MRTKKSKQHRLAAALWKASHKSRFKCEPPGTFIEYCTHNPSDIPHWFALAKAVINIK